MPPERLAELQRQRALVREHLAWLDREIAAAGAEPAAVPLPLAPHNAAPATPPASAADTYEPDAVSAELSARRGCLGYFAALLLLLFLALGALYFLRYRDRSLLFFTRDAPAETPPAVAPPKK